MWKRRLSRRWASERSFRNQTAYRLLLYTIKITVIFEYIITYMKTKKQQFFNFFLQNFCVRSILRVFIYKREQINGYISAILGKNE